MAKKEATNWDKEVERLDFNVSTLLIKMGIKSSTFGNTTIKIIQFNKIFNFDLSKFNDCIENYIQHGKKTNRSFFHPIPTFSIDGNKLVVRSLKDKKSFYELTTTKENNIDINFVQYKRVAEGEKYLKIVEHVLFENNYLIYGEKEATIDLSPNIIFGMNNFKYFLGECRINHDIVHYTYKDENDIYQKIFENDEFEQDGSKFKITQNEDKIELSANVSILNSLPKEKQMNGKAKIECVYTPEKFYCHRTSEEPDLSAILNHFVLPIDAFDTVEERKAYFDNPLEYYKNSTRPGFVGVEINFDQRFAKILEKAKEEADKKKAEKNAEAQRAEEKHEDAQKEQTSEEKHEDVQKTQTAEEKRKKLLTEAGKVEEKQQEVDIASSIKKQEELKKQEENIKESKAQSETKVQKTTQQKTSTQKTTQTKSTKPKTTQQKTTQQKTTKPRTTTQKTTSNPKKVEPKAKEQPSEEEKSDNE